MIRSKRKECGDLLNCKVNGVRKNLRYRILTIDKQTFVLDMGNALWKIIFPLLFWILPNPVYKVHNDIVEKLKSPEIEQPKIGGASVIAGIFVMMLANLLRPLGNYFNLPSNYIGNTIIVIILVLLVWSFYFYINNRSKKSIYHLINLDRYPKKKIWIRPQSFKHFFFILGSYLFLMGMTTLFLGGFIQLPNTLLLIAGIIAFFLSLLFSLLTVALGDNKVSFKKRKKLCFGKSQTKFRR